MDTKFALYSTAIIILYALALLFILNIISNIFFKFNIFQCINEATFNNYTFYMILYILSGVSLVIILFELLNYYVWI